ncbi:pentatricopeptide repeat-containing protein mitochondrial [Dorcoceras hygrometricum]|uniref:Pentatricopeptide repeat-containing protein mitochondrial n=1 Tax=Dorcoceras hygrometricum TaxID=472368 RepID=A0A2Z7CR98_9LAMI|nr:pentatricopeptide repeat-containing protein mitochondrial [Dorcoceras hygrometricum]KZV47269.1 pentatricopeptide repeat-containing protein mitochondrial [Dorcoceras hygrometricum]
MPQLSCKSKKSIREQVKLSKGRYEGIERIKKDPVNQKRYFQRVPLYDRVG